MSGQRYRAPDGTYECKTCGEWKQPSEFYYDMYNGRYKSRCKACSVRYQKGYNKVILAARAQRRAAEAEAQARAEQAALDALMADPED